MNQEELVEQHKKSYQAAITQHGDSLKSLYWASYKTAAQRYKELLVDVNLEGKTILDVGCGTGNLIPYLLAKCDNFSYRGIDIMSEFISQANTSYPGFNFAVADFWAKEYQETADIVVTCGTLNFAILDIGKRKEMVKKMFEQSKVATIFNMAGQHPIKKPLSKSGLIGYTDALEILNYCFTLTSKVVFRHHYHPNDFTIVLFHPQQK